MFLLVICESLEKYLYSNSLFNGAVCLFVVEFRSSLHILDNRPLSVTWFINIFFHFVGCLFIFFIVSFDVQKFLIPIKSNLSIFFYCCASVFFKLWLYINLIKIKIRTGTSLVVQWLRIHLPMQGTQVWSLVWELRSHMPQGS